MWSPWHRIFSSGWCWPQPPWGWRGNALWTIWYLALEWCLGRTSGSASSSCQPPPDSLAPLQISINPNRPGSKSSHVDCFATVSVYLLYYFWIHFGQIQQLFHTVKDPRFLSVLYYCLAHLFAGNVKMRESVNLRIDQPTIATLYSCAGLPQITCSACEECFPFLHLSTLFWSSLSCIRPDTEPHLVNMHCVNV